MLWWKKAWEKIKEYWQVIVGLIVGLGVAMKLWLELRAQRKVLANEVESAKKIRKVEKKFADDVEKSTNEANQKHNSNVIKIKDHIAAKEKEVEEELSERIEENKSGANEELAEKIGESFGVEVVILGDDDA